ncbi:hypothetical protein JTB14_012489 [Gonioctena quinquepunctata]|nr:hypothetical protein JTB14_012489 [Gonioctena quinquepunctata]
MRTKEEEERENQRQERENARNSAAFNMLQYISPLIIIIVVLLVQYHWSRRKLYEAASKLKGPRVLPLLGNAHLFYCKSEDVLYRISSVFEKVGKEPVRFWLGPYLMIGLKNPVHLEKIMSSSKFAYKHELYDLFESFVGDGLISASGKLHSFFLVSIYIE